jgi:hypothetical protein
VLFMNLLNNKLNNAFNSKSYRKQKTAGQPRRWFAENVINISCPDGLHFNIQ